MDFSVGDTLRVDGDLYDIIGKIRYKNLSDNCYWFEYRLISKGSRREKWLSFDSTYKEYSISESAWNISTNGYHLVDSGTEEVVGAWGDVDVEVGDRASFKEYEDRTEEKIISSEIWDDGEEMSTGYYLDLDEISIHSGDDFAGSSFGNGGFSGGTFYGNDSSGRNESNISKAFGIIVAILIVLMLLSNVDFSSGGIAKYLKNNSVYYTYVTSVTGNEKQKADVYKSSFTDVDATTKDIISGIDGATESVQQNTEDGDNSIAILTDKEYCLVYESEDKEVLVQVSSRKYAYTTDSSPYRSRYNTYRYYRRYYYSRGYAGDMGSFGKYTSPYSSFDDTTISGNTNDTYNTYNTYSSSVRQESVNARQSSGGGLSSGK